MPPKKLTIHTQQGDRSVIMVGPSLWGYIYREKTEGYFYRIIPVEDVQEVEKRYEIAELRNAPMKPQIAPISEAELEAQYIDNKIYFYIQYKMPSASTWIDIMAYESMDYQLLCLSRIISAIPKWLLDTRKNLIPLPSDIVFVDRTPFLLKLPSIGRPRIKSLFTEPSRIIYLAPELIRGKSLDVSDESVTNYAIGIQAIHCLYHWQDGDTAEMRLTKSANGTLLTLDQLQLRLSKEALNVPEINILIKSIQSLVSSDLRIRSAVNPPQLSKMIEQSALYLNPEYAVDEYIKRKEYNQAYQLLKKMLADHPTFSLYLLAAKLAGSHLKLISEALDSYEHALEMKKNAVEVFLLRIEFIISHLNTLMGKQKVVGSSIDLKRIDKFIENDFTHLPFKMQQKHVNKLAEYFIFRKMFDEADRILTLHFYDQDKTLLWWEFERWDLLIQALIGKKDYGRAKEAVQSLKKNLQLASRKPQIPKSQITKYGPCVAEHELRLHELTKITG